MEEAKVAMPAILCDGGIEYLLGRVTSETLKTQNAFNKNHVKLKTVLPSVLFHKAACGGKDPQQDALPAHPCVSE